MWTYHQCSGQLYHDGKLIATGYAGTGDGRNNPKYQCVIKVGPLPQGFYTIGKAYKHAKLGPICMNLEPDASNSMCGRSAFRIHGNNAANDASLGCMIFGPAIRTQIDESPDKRLQVVA